MKKLISILMLGTCLSSSFSLTSFAGRPGGASAGTGGASAGTGGASAGTDGAYAGTGGASETPGSNRKKVEIEIPGSNGKKIIIFEEADSDIDDIDSETISENPIIQYSEEVSSNKKPRINIEQKKKEHGNQKYKVPEDATCPKCGEHDTLCTRGKDPRYKGRYKGKLNPNIGIILCCENCIKEENSCFIYGATKHIKKYSEENTSDKGPRPTINIEQKKKKHGKQIYEVPEDAKCPDCGKNYTLHTRGKSSHYKGNPDPNIGIRLYCENCNSYFVYGTTRHKKIKSPISKPTDLEKE